MRYLIMQSSFLCAKETEPGPETTEDDPNSSTEPESAAATGGLRVLPWKLNQSFLPTEKAERAVKANQSRRAPNPGGRVQTKRLILDRSPKNIRPVQRGRQDQPINNPIMMATQIGTTQTKMSTNVSIIAGLFINSTNPTHLSTSIF